MDEYPKRIYIGSTSHLVNSEAEERALRPQESAASTPTPKAPEPKPAHPEPEPETDADTDEETDDDEGEAPDAGYQEPRRKAQRKAKPARTEKPKPSRTPKRKARVVSSPAKPLKRKPKHK